MYTTVAQNKYCEYVKRLLFVDILNISVVVLQVIFILYELVDWSSHGRHNRAQTRC